MVVPEYPAHAYIHLLLTGSADHDGGPSCTQAHY